MKDSIKGQVEHLRDALHSNMSLLIQNMLMWITENLCLLLDNMADCIKVIVNNVVFDGNDIP